MDNEIGAPDSPMTEEMDFVEDQYGDGLTDSYLTDVESVISVNKDIQAPTNEAESIVEGIQRIEVGGRNAERNRRRKEKRKAIKTAAKAKSLVELVVQKACDFQNASVPVAKQPPKSAEGGRSKAFLRDLGMPGGSKASSNRVSGLDVGGTKRGANQLTPPTKTDEKKRKLFNEVAVKALKARVFFKDRVLGDLNVDQYNEMVSRIEKLLDRVPEKETVPTFHGFGHSLGSAWIHSSTQFAWDWLESALASISKDWQHGELTMSAWEIRVPRKKGVLILPWQSDEQFSVELVFNRLRRSNPGLDTRRWKVNAVTSPNPNRKLVHLGFDIPSVEFLRGIDFRPFYRLGHATIRLHGLNSEGDGV